MTEGNYVRLLFGEAGRLLCERALIQQILTPVANGLQCAVYWRGLVDRRQTVAAFR